MNRYGIIDIWPTTISPNMCMHFQIGINCTSQVSIHINVFGHEKSMHYNKCKMLLVVPINVPAASWRQLGIFTHSCCMLCKVKGHTFQWPTGVSFKPTTFRGNIVCSFLIYFNKVIIFFKIKPAWNIFQVYKRVFN